MKTIKQLKNIEVYAGLLAIFLVFSGFTNGKGSDRDKSGVIGSVKKLVEKVRKPGQEEVIQYFSVSYDQKGRELEVISNTVITKYQYSDKNMVKKGISFEKDGVPRESSLAKFDAAGNLIELTRHDENGKVSETTKYIYNNEGYQTQVLSFQKEDLLVAKQVLTYFPDGKVKERVFYSPDNALKRKVNSEYNASGLLTKMVSYKPSGLLEETTEFSYDSKGNIAEKRVLSGDGILKSREKYSYTYDSIGNWVTKTLERKVFDPSGKTRDAKYEFTRELIYY